MALARAFAEIPHTHQKAAQSEAAAPSEAFSHETIERTRAEFIENLYLASKHRQLTVEQAQHPGFHRFVSWFQQKHKDFPLSAELARAWAIGSQELAEQLAAELRYIPRTTKPIIEAPSNSTPTWAQIAALTQQIVALLPPGISWTQRTWAANPVLFAGIAGGIIVLFAAQRTLHRRGPAHSTRVVGKQAAYTVIFNSARNETIFLPIKTDSTPQLIIADTASSGETVQTRAEPGSLSVLPMDLQWENQLRSSEKRAEELLAQVRAGLAPHLARHLTSQLVRKLVDDRARLLEAQKIACAEVATLEQRFARIHSELQERLRDYQARNIQLEKQLAERTDQNRQLLRTQIASLQQKLQ